MYYMFTCRHSIEILVLGGRRGYCPVYIPVYNTYSLVILICFISTGKELRKVEQQTQVYKKQQQFGM